MRPKFNRRNYGGTESKYCQGYIDNNKLSTYALLPHLGVVSVPRDIGVDGLDKINAFDMAEIDGAYFGQFNMITVSSFCGPKGVIAGHDFLAPDDEQEPLFSKEGLPVYSADPLLKATIDILGTVDERRFPILPGSHVPCANKKYTTFERGEIYAMFSLTIPEDREKDACLIMEDAGSMKKTDSVDSLLEGLVESSIVVCKNQRIKPKKIYTGIKTAKVKRGEVGCALVALAYLKLAKDFF